MKYRWLFFLLVPCFVGLLSWQIVQGWDDGRSPDGGIPAPSLWVFTEGLDFGPVTVNQMGWWYFAFKNIGNAPLSITNDAAFAAPFSGTLPACATDLAPNGVCTYIIFFSPTATGDFNQTINFETNAGPFSIQLQGSGVNPNFYVNPLSLDFGSVLVGNSQIDSIIIQNTSAYHLDLTTSSPPSPHFGSSSGDCSGGVSAGDSCTVFLNFTPTQTGSFTDTYTINTDAGTTLIELQGKGRSVPFLFGPQQRVTPHALDFGPVSLGDSKTLTVTITNQSFDEPITGWVGGGISGSPFSATQNCASGVPVGADCQFFYTFTPTAVGEFTAQSNASNSAGSFSIDMRGEGAASEPLVLETILNLGPTETVLGQDSALKNSGHFRLFINQVTTSNPNISPNYGCGSGLAPYLVNTYCPIDYDYNTTTPDLITETATIATNGGNAIISLKAGSQSPAMIQTFNPHHIAADGTSTIQYEITNPNQATTFFFVEFSNTLPLGMVYANPLSLTASPGCGLPDLLPIAGSPPTFSLENGTILGGDSCLISFNVTVPTEGEYPNSIPAIEAAPDPNNPSWKHSITPIADTLRVGPFYMYLPTILQE